MKNKNTHCKNKKIPKPLRPAGCGSSTKVFFVGCDVVRQIGGHSRGFLSGIFNARCLLNKGKSLFFQQQRLYIEDPRLQPSGMTSCLTTTTANGFTLIELLVVVLIIGILAAVAVPQYQVAVLKSRYVQLMAFVNTATQAAQAYHLANGKYPENGRNWILPSRELPMRMILHLTMSSVNYIQIEKPKWRRKVFYALYRNRKGN